MASDPITSWLIDGEKVKSVQILFSWAPKSPQMMTAAMKLKRHLLLGRKAMTNLDSILKSIDITLSTKIHIVKAMVFPIVMYGCERWTITMAECWRIKSPLDCKEIKPINPKGNQPWIFFERIDAEAPILWPPDVKSKLIRKDPDAGKDWRQKERRAGEDEIIR